MDSVGTIGKIIVTTFPPQVQEGEGGSLWRLHDVQADSVSQKKTEGARGKIPLSGKKLSNRDVTAHI